MIPFEWLLLYQTILQLNIGAAYSAPNGSYIWKVRRLYDHLMEDYSKSIRPVDRYNRSVMVYVKLSAFSVVDLDEKNQVFKISGRLSTGWRDYGLMWYENEDFKELMIITIAINDIWIPDITVYNSKDVYYSLPTHHLDMLGYNGDVFSVQPVNIETHCQLDLSEFPFDEHVCQVVFGSWTHNIFEILVTSPDIDEKDADNDSLLKNALHENAEWKLMKVTVEHNIRTYPCCPRDIYLGVTYNFTIKRSSTFTTHLFIGPSVMLCIVTPVVFLLPPGSGEKMMFGIGVLITDTLLLGELINYIPTAHPNLPLIAKYFLANIIMASLSLAISAIIISFWDKSSSRLSGPPVFLEMIFLGPVAKVMYVRKDDLFSRDEISSRGIFEINPEGEEGTESTSGVDAESDKKRRFMSNYLRNAARSEWRQLAVVFDRLLFVIYCVIIAILTLSFARCM